MGRGGGELPGGGGGTEARLSLQLSDRMRLQGHLARGALIPSVTLQYSSEGIAGGLGGAGGGGGSGGLGSGNGRGEGRAVKGGDGVKGAGGGAADAEQEL